MDATLRAKEALLSILDPKFYTHDATLGKQDTSLRSKYVTLT